MCLQGATFRVKRHSVPSCSHSHSRNARLLCTSRSVVSLLAPSSSIATLEAVWRLPQLLLPLQLLPKPSKHYVWCGTARRDGQEIDVSELDLQLASRLHSASESASPRRAESSFISVCIERQPQSRRRCRRCLSVLYSTAVVVAIAVLVATN